jgi:hypothetical protein
MEQVLLAEHLDNKENFSPKLWDLLRVVSCWIIWKDCCAHVIPKRKAHFKGTICRIKRRLHVYIGHAWKAPKAKVKTGKLSWSKAVATMLKDFGLSREV